MFGYTSSPSVGEELVEIVARDQPDVVVIDAMFTSALNVSPQFGRPTAVMLHTFLYRLMDIWRANFTMQSQSRQRAGFEPLPPLEQLWGARDVLHVNTLAAFDAEPVGTLPHVVHGAPVLASEERAVAVNLPWAPDDPNPVVLLSFSTVSEQRNTVMFQRALDALAPLPVHVVATTGQIIDPSELSVPANAWLTTFADHDQMLERATFVVGHGGHGTTMRALRHGRPLVGIPALALDQVPITQLFDAWGVGRGLPPDADIEQIRAAAEEILNDGRFTTEAKRRSTSLAGPDGAHLAADSVEQLLAPRSPA